MLSFLKTFIYRQRNSTQELGRRPAFQKNIRDLMDQKVWKNFLKVEVLPYLCLWTHYYSTIMKHHKDHWVSLVSQPTKDVRSLQKCLLQDSSRTFISQAAQTPLTIKNCRIYFLILSFSHCKTVLPPKRQESEMHFHSEKYAFIKILLSVISQMLMNKTCG